MAEGQRRAVVTGAARGIGYGTAKRLLDEGVSVIAVDVNETGLQQIKADGATILVADLGDPEARARVIEAGQGIDYLVNAAGIAVLGSVEDTDLAAWKRVLAINLDGTFLGCKYAMPLLRKNGGSIVNLSSVSGLIGGHNLAAYNASKGGVSLLSKSVALYGARLKPPVRCNSVHPAFLEGPMVDDILAQTGRPDMARAQIARDIPLGRLGTPAEVAELCVYLLSDESAFVTGAEFAIDGGLTAR